MAYPSRSTGLHEEIVGHPIDNTDFVLSLKPELSYHLSEMRIAYTNVEKATEENQPSQPHAEQFCWHLNQTAHCLDQKHKSNLKEDGSRALGSTGQD
ncbi:hypothetical protein J2X01_000307 [Arthrobacter ginsengisoli]|uniref:Uncharacterized protein n=1 Tax=Arthrobacter ginsengisoli TaxID=1356565 RepID=A0ABU1U773_9MICC|nr:hypothetical protein [Arthrobacter ginsengisoli]MDR7081038.1 hypothetical protein [Arthrobacter ginsengisoli]